MDDFLYDQPRSLQSSWLLDNRNTNSLCVRYFVQTDRLGPFRKLSESSSCPRGIPRSRDWPHASIFNDLTRLRLREHSDVGSKKIRLGKSPVSRDVNSLGFNTGFALRCVSFAIDHFHSSIVSLLTNGSTRGPIKRSSPHLPLLT